MGAGAGGAEGVLKILGKRTSGWGWGRKLRPGRCQGRNRQYLPLFTSDSQLQVLLRRNLEIWVSRGWKREGGLGSEGG